MSCASTGSGWRTRATAGSSRPRGSCQTCRRVPGRGGLARWLERQSGLGHVTARQVAAVIGDGGIEALDGDQDALARCLAVVPSRFPEPCAPPRAGPGTTWRGCLPGSWATGSGRHGCTGLADLDGSWFVLADGVVSALGVAPLLGGRLRAPVVHAIHEAAAEEGHVHLPGGGGDQVQRGGVNETKAVAPARPP